MRCTRGVAGGSPDTCEPPPRTASLSSSSVGLGEISGRFQVAKFPFVFFVYEMVSTAVACTCFSSGGFPPTCLRAPRPPGIRPTRRGAAPDITLSNWREAGTRHHSSARIPGGAFAVRFEPPSCGERGQLGARLVLEGACWIRAGNDSRGSFGPR